MDTAKLLLSLRRAPAQLIEAYRSNPVFYAIVTKHVIAGSDYTTMLEEAVVALVKEVAACKKVL